MPTDPRTGARRDDATLDERDNGTQAKPADSTLVSPAEPINLSDVTLQPPPKPKPEPPPSTLARLTAAPATEFAADSTLVPPPRTVGAKAQRTIISPVATPHDATLDPDSPLAKAYEAAVASSTPPPQQASFGDYQLLETIAKGGMGVVYKARQRKLNRIVAIKMILAGQFADQTDVDRFYAEASAAGALRHPNIVGIHEIGEVNGQHFFSMDYIEGESLSGLVRESPLTATRAAEYVKTIAETVQFAHEHGIVHRDLKPSNVLLDKNLRPLITDFGLAKQVSSQNQSQLTMEGAIVGTPSYMPPEQARGDGDRVGPCSDIYSTGAILYELVTGRPPFRAASPFETVRQVLDTEPLSPRQLNPNVPKDLETICLKCLQKEPGKRYATSQALADELGRFLRHEPIQARPIGRAARLWRLCRRNPVPAGAIAASVLFLIIAAISASIGLVQTRRALAVSEASFREQMNAVNDLFTSVSENTLLNQPGLQPLQKDLLQRALAYYERFAKQRADDPAVMDELAVAHFRIGAITERLDSADKALPEYETARAMQEQLLHQQPKNRARLEALGNTLNAIGTLGVRQKDFDSAQSAYASALETRLALQAADPDDTEFVRLLANTRMNIGVAHYNAGDFTKALAELKEAQRLRQETLAKDPENVKLRRDLGKGDFNLGNVLWVNQQADDAEKHFQAAVATFQALLKDQPGDFENNKLHAVCLRFLGDIKADTSLEVARERYGKAIEVLDELVSKNPDVVDYQIQLAGVWMNLGDLETRHKQVATVQFQRARKVLAALVERYPSELRFQSDLAKTLHALGFEQKSSRDFDAAREQFAEASRLLAGLVKRSPTDADYLTQYAGISQELGTLEAEQGNAAAAVAAYETAVQCQRDLVKLAPEEPWLKYDLAVALRTLADAQSKAGALPAAGASLQEAQAIAKTLRKQAPDEPAFKKELDAIDQAILANNNAS
jgi:tetratricopeptide (TPR) repeat protein/tRNA A-37 threonylcarbamoyl transferase component Bud32